MPSLPVVLSTRPGPDTENTVATIENNDEGPVEVFAAPSAAKRRRVLGPGKESSCVRGVSVVVQGTRATVLAGIVAVAVRGWESDS